MVDTVKFRGALTFENDDDMAEALADAEATLNEQSKQNDTLLTMEDIAPLGLHLTVNTSAKGNAAQIDDCKTLVHKLAAHAYSGYIDVIIRDEQERFHSKEIEPKRVELADIID